MDINLSDCFLSINWITKKPHMSHQYVQEEAPVFTSYIQQDWISLCVQTGCDNSTFIYILNSKSNQKNVKSQNQTLTKSLTKNDLQL
jgi:hypothetical protein